MNGASGVTRVRSVSSTGLSVVYVEFEWDTDIYEPADRHRAARPGAARSAAGRAADDGADLVLYGRDHAGRLSSGTLDPMELREIADWVVAPRLKAIPGVSRVVPIGGLVKEYRVTVDNLRMSQLGISLDDLETALAQFGGNTGGGFVDQGAQEFLIRNLSRTHDLEDLRNVVVDHRDGQPVLLRQVADVAFEPKQRRGDAGFMGCPGVILSIQKQPTADTVELTARSRRCSRDCSRRCRRAPASTNISFVRRISSMRRSTISKQVLTEAIVVVAIILFLFLFNARTTVISLLAIPVSVLTTFIVLRWMGLTINTMTLGGLAIAIGELVDDAVVDVENIYRRLRENKHRAQSAAGARGHRRGLAGGSLEHRLFDDDHRPGLRAAVRAPRDRGPALRAARRRLHRLDPGEPDHLDHADAGAVLLSAAEDEEPGASARASSCGS